MILKPSPNQVLSVVSLYPRRDVHELTKYLIEIMEAEVQWLSVMLILEGLEADGLVRVGLSANGGLSVYEITPEGTFELDRKFDLAVLLGFLAAIALGLLFIWAVLR